jgi:putative MFS transporter
VALDNATRIKSVTGSSVMLERLERQTRLTVNQWKIMIAAILGDMLDFFDYFLIGYVLALDGGGLRYR